MGSKTQCRPWGPPSDLPVSIAASTSSSERGDLLYVASLERVSFTSSVMRFNVSCDSFLRRSPESYRRNQNSKTTPRCAYGEKLLLQYATINNNK